MLAEFGDVGLMTGDVTINPSATCLVMTTEVRPQKIVSSLLLIFYLLDSTLYALPGL